jgi:citrate synthase
MVVAEKLGYTLQELMERITVEELQLWAVFYEIRNEQEKAAIEKSRRRR